MVGFNPNNLRHQERLEKATRSSRAHLQPFRSNRLQMLREYVGSNWGLGGSNVEVVANFMQQMALIYVQRLAGGKPRVNIAANHQGLWAFAHKFKQALNNLAKEIKLKRTIQRMVLDAFFTMGLAKVYLKESPRMQMMSGVWMDPGQIYVDPLSFDNFILDTRCNHWDRRMYAGDMYRVPYERVMENKNFNEQGKRNLHPSSKHGSPDDRSRVSTILTGGKTGDDDEIVDMVDLVDYHFPNEQLISTWAIDRGSHLSFVGPPLQVREWDGAERGPYHNLGFIPVVDSPMPAAPGQGMLLLHQTMNSVLRKLIGQANRQRDIPVYAGGGEHDARRIMGAQDGMWTALDDPENVDILKIGGVDDGNAGFFSSLMLLADRMGGNLSTMGGLGTQAETLGQEKMLGENIAESEAAYHEAVLEMTQGIFEDCGLMMWHDPVMEVPDTIRVPGDAQMSVDNTWTPDHREGDYWQYNFEVQPYTLQHRSPSAVVSSIMQIMTQLLIPAEQSLAQVGGRLDWQEVTTQLADMLDLPWLPEIIKYDQPIETERPGPSGGQPRQAAHTVREQIRRNVPTGGTQNNQWQQQQMSWNNRAAQNPAQKMSQIFGGAA